MIKLKLNWSVLLMDIHITNQIGEKNYERMPNHIYMTTGGIILHGKDSNIFINIRICIYIYIYWPDKKEKLTSRNLCSVIHHPLTVTSKWLLKSFQNWNFKDFNIYFHANFKAFMETSKLSCKLQRFHANFKAFRNLDVYKVCAQLHSLGVGMTLFTRAKYAYIYYAYYGKICIHIFTREKYACIAYILHFTRRECLPLTPFSLFTITSIPITITFWNFHCKYKMNKTNIKLWI